MTDEGAKVLAEAIKLLAQAIELATAGSGMAPKGIHVYHHGTVPNDLSATMPRYPYRGMVGG